MTVDKWASFATIGSFVVPIIISIIILFNKIMKHFHRLEEQYTPNGGSSMRDAIDRIEKRINKIDKELSVLCGKFEQHIIEGDK